MKESTKTILLFLVLILTLIFAPSCTKYSKVFPTLCDGNCDVNYTVLYKNQLIQPNTNGHYEIQWDGLNYFQIKGSLTELREDYVINKIPLVSADFDSDYWILFDTLRFQTPMYSYLGWFNDQSLNTPISMGNYTYTLNDLISLHPPYNIAGYQLPKHFCTDCPYAPDIVGSHSRYNYDPKQNFLLDNEMVGDTINIFIKTIFNTDGGIYYTNSDDMVPQKIIEEQIKIIVI